MKSSKPFLGISLSILFVILGIYLINRSNDSSENSSVLLFAGIACIVFFGGILIATLFRLFK